MRKIQKAGILVSVLALLLAALPMIPAAAETTGTCGDNLTWALNNEGILTISGEGEMSFYETGNSQWAFDSSILKVVIQEGVTSIESNAFYGCDKLADIILPDSLVHIADRAFEGTAYYLQDSNWENDVLYIGNHLIKAKENITGNYEVRSGTKTIADCAFYNCTGLVHVAIPEGVTNIGNNAFEGCTSLASIALPEGVTRINSNLFSRCENLTDIAIPESVTSISAYAFSGCSSLEQIILPQGVTEIWNHAFEFCSSLASITIPQSVTSLPEGVFLDCTSLRDISLSAGIKDIGLNAFCNCTSLESVTIPEGATNIGYGAFLNCTSLASISLPDSLTRIREDSFLNCPNLQSVTIPAGVTEIEEKAFGYYVSEDLMSTRIQDFILVGNPGTAAEKYAEENYFAFVRMQDITWGNVNGDPDVTSSDALTVLQAVTGKVILDDVQMVSANVDGKGGVTSADALMVLQYATQKIDSFPAAK